MRTAKPTGSSKARTRRPRGFLPPSLALLVLAAACAGGIPKIPNSADAIIGKADAYFHRGKYFQAQEMYKAFLSRHPGDDRSDYAQFRLGESYFQDKEYAPASVEYQILVSDYGYSDYVDDAFFKLALCLYHQSPRADLDQTNSLSALSKLDEFMRAFPNSALVPEAQSTIRRIHEKLAKKAFVNALFYLERRKNNEAALIYLNKIIDNYPDNEYWVRAMFYKAKILRGRGEDDEAKKLLSQVVSYPKELDVKRDARLALQELMKE